MKTDLMSIEGTNRLLLSPGSKLSYAGEHVTGMGITCQWDWYIRADHVSLGPEFQDFFGYKQDEIGDSAVTWLQLICDEDQSEHTQCLDEHFRSHGLNQYDTVVRYCHKDGSMIWVRNYGKVVEWDEDGHPLRMIGGHVDVTQFKETEENLRNENTELQQSTYMITHDLQEPLNAIMGLIEILDLKDVDYSESEISSIIKQIKKSSSCMKQMIEDLLDYSRLGHRCDLEEVDLEELMDEILAGMSVVISESMAEIIVDDLPVARCCRQEMRQLFQNIIANAIKFRSHEISPRIQIQYRKEKDHHSFTVQDNGIGIAPEDRITVFGMFRRLHSKSQYEGSGIGLAHCKKIVELHRGDIWVETSPGGGSRFRFTISTDL